MKKIAYSSLFYTFFGLFAGLFFREFPRVMDLSAEAVNQSQLSFVHTHAISLGTFFFLIVLILTKLFQLETHKHFNKFFISYHIGFGITIFTMFVHGIFVSLGNQPHPAFSGIAGIGHILLTIAFGIFFNVLVKKVNEPART